MQGTKKESVIVEWMSKEECFTFLESSKMYVWVKGNKFLVNMKDEIRSSYLSSSLSAAAQCKL